MRTALRDNNPVVNFEDKLMYNDKAPGPVKEYLIPFVAARVLSECRDSTLSGTSSMVPASQKAALMLAATGIRAEVIARRARVPLDEEAPVNSKRKVVERLLLMKAI